MPFFPRIGSAENKEGMSRKQLAVTLAWALTPWKAQGMSLEQVTVKLGAAASKPGVAFVALTRARHPDGLALDDNFPVFSAFQKQKQHLTFQYRQRFERVARCRFSRTIRKHMADATIYSPERVWSVSDNTLADALLRFVADNPTKEDEEVLQAFAESPAYNRAFSHDREVHVWKRLTTQYPHMFEVAEARRTLSQLRLDGHLGQTKPLEPLCAADHGPSSCLT